MSNPVQGQESPGGSGGSDSGGDGRETLSQLFNKKYASFREVMELDSSEKGQQLRVKALINDFEKLTKIVSDISMFSVNESLEDMDPPILKFLLLPYFLGSLWGRINSGDRDEISRISYTYIKDFLERLRNYKIIEIPLYYTPLLKDGLLEELSTSDSPTLPSRPGANNLRELKIGKMKENKALDDKIKGLELEENVLGEALDEEVVRDLGLSLLRRAGNEAFTELDSIITEIQLLKYRSKMGSGGKAESSTAGSGDSSSGLPFQTFILAKSDAQKKVFGLGYPSLPVMTVEELYESRIAEGIWEDPTKPKHGPSGGPPPDPDIEKDEHEDSEDPEARARALQMDEYKDMHRRGWGNRANRS